LGAQPRAQKVGSGRRLRTAFDPTPNTLTFDVTATGTNLPIGVENRVSPRGAGSSMSSVTGLVDGGWVVTYEQFVGTGIDVFQQRFDAEGVAVGGAVRVNTTTTGDQRLPDVAALPDGGWLVVWQQPDASGTGAYWQRFDATGAMVGSESFGGASRSTISPTVDVLSDGGWIITWNDIGTIFQNRFTAGGVSVGGNTAVYTSERGQGEPDITALSDGGWVVIWYGSAPSYDTKEEISQQRYAANGSAVGDRTQVNATVADVQTDASVAALADGGWVVTWVSLHQDGDDFDIYQQRFDENGIAVGGEQSVNTYTSGFQATPAVTGLPDGGWVVTWMSVGQDGDSQGVYQQRFDASGTAVEGERRVNTTTSGAQGAPAITTLADGDWVITWRDGAGTVSQQRFGLNEHDPVLVTAIPDQSSPEDVTWTFTVPANAFSDEDDNPLTYSASLADGAALPSWLTFNAATRTFSGRPPQDVNGTFDVKVTATDTVTAASDVFRLTILPVNDAPRLANPVPNQEGLEDALWTFTVPATTFADIDGDTLTYSATTQGGGSLPIWMSFDPLTRTFLGTPTVGGGFVAIRVTASDGTASAVANFVFTIGSVNDAPTTSPVTLSASNEDTARTITRLQLLANARDLDGDTLSVTDLAASSGSLADNGDGTWTFTPGTNDTASVTFTYTISDGNGGTVPGSATLAINPVPDDAIISGPSTGALTEDGATAVASGVLTVTDPDAGEARFAALDPAALNGTYGAFAFDAATGAWSYTLDNARAATQALAAGQQVTETLTVTSLDGTATRDIVVTVTGAGDNAAPAGTDATLTLAEDSVRAFTAADFGFTDPDSGAALAAVRIDTLPAAGSLTFDGIAVTRGQVIAAADLGKLVFTPEANANGASFASLTFSVSDGSAFDPTPNRLTFDVTPLNDGVDDPTPIPLGTDIQVNATTTGTQFRSSLAALADGGFIVTWSSFDQDGSGYGIYGQRYDATGAPAGTEFRVSTETASNQAYSSVVALADGGFVATWMSTYQDGDRWGIYGQRYDATGATAGTEFQVNTVTTNDQIYSSVAALSDGGFIVTWSSLGQDGSDYGMYGQRYDATGATVGTEFQVNTETTFDQLYSSVAAHGDGGFVVTWSSFGQDGDRWGVYGQRYDADGVPAGGEFRINTVTSSDQNYSSVAALADGGFVVTWSSDGQDGDGWGIYGQRYDADGAPSGREFRVNTETTSNQIWSAVTTLADGGFVVTWSSGNQDGSGWGIYGQRYDATGAEAGTEFRLNDTTTGNQATESSTGGEFVAQLADGRLVATWSGLGTEEVFVRLFDLPELNTPPEGADQTITLAEDSVRAFTAADFGFTDPDAGAALAAVRIDTLPAAGSLTFDGIAVTPGQVIAVADLGKLAFMPEANETGAGHASLGFSVSDGTAFDPTPNTLTFDVTPVNDAPTTSPVVMSPSNEDSARIVTAAEFLANAGDFDGDALSVTDLVASSGALSDNGNGSWTFTPGTNDATAVSFTYTISDGNGGTVPGSATLAIDPVPDDATIFGPSTGALTEDGATVVASGVLTVTDPDAGEARFAALDPAALNGTYGAFAFEAATGAWSYTLDNARAATQALAAGQQVIETLAVASLDGTATRDIVVTVTGAGDNAAPAGTDATLTLAEDSVRAFTAADFGFADPDAGAALAAVRIDTLPAAGSLTFDGIAVTPGQVIAAADLGKFAFTPEANANGASFASLTFSVSDGTAFDPTPNRLTFDVTPLNDGVDDPTPIPLGTDIQVNSFTTDIQRIPSLARLAEGGFVVTWSSFGQDGNGWGIYGQRYDATGATVGGEFRVNTYPTSDQQYSSVAALADGGFVVTWSSQGQDGSDRGIYGQRYDVDGVPAGGEFRINTVTTNNQDYSSVAALADGGFVVTWSSLAQDGSLVGVYGQRYNAFGEPVGVEFRVNTETSSDQDFSSVAALADGGFVVTWLSLGQDGSEEGIYGQRYDALGAPAGGEFRVNTETADNQQYPSVVALADGGFLVTWSSDGQDGSGNGIYGQRYDAIGAMVGGEFRVNTEATGDQGLSSTAALADGGFVVTWSSFGQDGDDWGIYGQRYDATGAPAGVEFRLNDITAGAQINVSQYGSEFVAQLVDGRLVATWAGRTDQEVSVRLFDLPELNGPPEGADQSITLAEDGVRAFTAADFGFTDPDAGAALAAVRIDTLPAAGSLTFNGIAATPGQVIAVADIGKLAFAPETNGTGAGYASLGFSVSDGSAFDPTPNTLTFDVTPLNDAPTTSPVVLSPSSEDTARVITAAELLANASDVDGDTLSVTDLLASSGTLSDNGNGSWTFTPAANDATAVSFTYTIRDGSGDTVAGSATLDLLPVNDAPTVARAIGDQASREDAPFSFTIPDDTFFDRDGDALTYTATRADGSALPDWLTFDAGTRSFSGTPPLDFNGVIGLTVTASDGTLTVSEVFDLTITADSDAPVVARPVGDQRSPEDTVWTFTIPDDTFFDRDGDALTYTATRADGSALPDWLIFDAGTRSFSGTPPLDFNGTLGLTVTASDGTLGVTETFDLTISSVNDAPTTSLVTLLPATSEDGSRTLTAAELLATASDADLDPLAVAGLAASSGTLVDNGDGTWTFTPAGDDDTLVSFTYTIDDGEGGTVSGAATLDLVPVNDVPVADDDAVAAVEGETPQGNVLANDDDVDAGQALTITRIVGPNGAGIVGQEVFGRYGSLTLQSDGSYTYAAQNTTLPEGAVATDTFSYTVSDGNGGTDTADIVVTVTGGNPPFGNNAPNLRGFIDPRFVAEAAGDLDGNGTLDVLWRNGATDAVELWTTAADGAVTRTDLGTVGANWTVEAVGNLDGRDGDDIVFRDTATDAVGAWVMRGGGRPSDWRDLGTLSAEWEILGAGDFDRSGTDDLLLFNVGTRAVDVWSQDPDAPGARATVGTLPTGWTVAGIGDLDGDGTDDVLVYDAVARSLGAWQMNEGKIGGWYDYGTLNVGWDVTEIGNFSGAGPEDIGFYNAATGADGAWVMSPGQAGDWLAGRAHDELEAIGVGRFGSATDQIVWHNPHTGGVYTY
jgi:VCBS repeat-containing protein